MVFFVFFYFLDTKGQSSSVPVPLSISPLWSSRFPRWLQRSGCTFDPRGSHTKRDIVSQNPSRYRNNRIRELASISVRSFFGIMPFWIVIARSCQRTDPVNNSPVLGVIYDFVLIWICRLLFRCCVLLRTFYFPSFFFSYQDGFCRRRPLWCERARMPLANHMVEVAAALTPSSGGVL